MTTLMTPATAPRNLDELAKQGPFIHRRLGEQLEQTGFKCWNNERDKTAFVTASPQDRAQMLLTQLHAFDAAHGGAPPAAQPEPATPPPQAAPAAPPPARAPVTTAGSNGYAAHAPPTPSAPTGGVLELLTAIKGLSDQLGTLAAQTTANANNVAPIGSLAQEVKGLKAMLSASIKMQEVQLGLLYLFGQQVLQAPGEAILESAVTDATVALGLLEKLSGKG